MELRIEICAILFLVVNFTEEKATTNNANEHYPPLNVHTFRRDSVEHVPDVEFSSPLLKYEEFGSKSLPLRAAVERIPDVNENSRRLPLRDAVEKRLPPDETFSAEEDFRDSTYHSAPYRIKPSGRLDFASEDVSPGENSPYQYVPRNQFPSTFSQQFPQFSSQNWQVYSPLQNFHKILADYRSAAPYRVDNSYQQLLVSPFAVPRGKRLISFDGPVSGRNIQSGRQNAMNSQKIVCYVEGIAAYRREPFTFHPGDLDPFICTHIIYSYATIDPITYNMISNDEAYDIIQGGYKAVTNLKKLNQNLKVLISIGGSREDGSRRFSKLVANARRRRNFIRSAISFVKQYDFDGIEIDWKYPGDEDLGGQSSDRESFMAFLEEISEIFKQRGWLFTLSAPGSRFRAEDGFQPSKLGEVVDFVNIQAYDFHIDREQVADHPANLYARSHDDGLNIFLSVDYAVQYWIKKGLPRSKLILSIPFYGRSFTLKYANETEIGSGIEMIIENSVHEYRRRQLDYAVQYWIKKGLPRSKLILSIPFYGRSFTLKYANETEIGSGIKGPGRQGLYTQNPGLLAYFEICEMIQNEGWFKSQDDAGSPFIMNGDQWVGYDDIDSTKRKVNYVTEQQLGGVSVKSADFDDFKGICGEKWPLLSVINRELKGVDPFFLSGDESIAIQPSGKCDSTGYYSDSKNCAAYYICKNGLTYHLSCGNNLMFNPINGKCEQFDPEKCRPGGIIHIPTSLKNFDISSRQQEVKVTRPKVVCYVTSWAFYRKAEGKFVPEHIDQRLCTHIVYAFASLDPQNLLLKEFDPWADIDNNLYQRITSLKDTKVILSLGGWTDSSGDKYSRLVSDGTARRRFVIGVVSFLRKHGFKGLHFDWNYPTCWQSDCKRGPSSDKSNFAKLLQQLKTEFDRQNPPMILAAAISGYKEIIDLAYDLPALGKSLDFLSVMTYDYHGAWERQTGHVSPLYGTPNEKYPQYNTNYTMEYLVSLGAPRDKLLLGIPFYGQSFTLTRKSDYGERAPSLGPGEAGEYTKQPGMLAYYEICNRVRNRKWIANKNSASMGPYAYNNDQWVGYEDISSVAEKAKYIKSRGFGGAVAWTIDLDDFNNNCCGGAFPLLRSLGRELGIISDQPVDTDCTKPPAPSTPLPPVTTTGVDSGASSEHHHHEEWTSPTTERTTTGTWWSSTTSSATTSRPSTSTQWWPNPSTTSKPNKPWSTESTSTSVSSTKPSTLVTWWSVTTSTSTDPTTSTVWWTPTESTTSRPITQQTPEGGVTIPSPAVVRPEVGTPSMSCEPGQYLPDPANCNAFYRCVIGELKKQYCAGGLHWNKEQNTCDWPSASKCVEEKQPTKKPKPTTSWQAESTTEAKPPTEKPKPTTSWQTQWKPSSEKPKPTTSWQTEWKPPTKKPKPTASWQTESTTEAKPPTKKPKPTASWQTESTTRTPFPSWTYPAQYTMTTSQTIPSQTLTDCQNGAYYPHERCSHFYVCYNNQLIAQRCAPGLSFDAQTSMCDWSFKVKCSGRKMVAEHFTLIHNRYTEDRPQPYTTCNGNAFAPRPGSCTQYMDCQWGKYEIRDCAAGLHWNNERKICDWPQNAQCSEDPDQSIDIETNPSPPDNPSPVYPQWSPPTSTQAAPVSTTEWSESSSNEWEWHPPIPPTSEKPPLSEPLKPFSGYFKVVCYFTNWAWYRKGAGKYLPEDIDESLCTHVVYGFAVLDYSNHVIKAHDSWADFDNQFYKRVVGYKSKGIKVSIAIGGWNDSQGDKYSKLVNNPAARKRFIEHVMKFLDKHNFDGLDLDWEYPKCWQVDCSKGPDSDKPAFAEFVREIKAAFRPRGYLLSAAVSPSKTVIDAGYDVQALAESLDWVAVMTYDFHGQWDKKTGHVAPLYYHPEDEVAFFNSNYSINYWISEGVPRRKIVMGMPLYGQSFRLEKEENNGLNAIAPGPGEAGEYTRAPGFLAYYEICDNIKNKGWTVVQDRLGRMGPYAYKGNQWVSFDDKEMIRKKSEFIRSMDIGGGMIWALDLDDFKNKCGEGRHPLLTIIRNVLADPGSGHQEVIDELPQPPVLLPQPSVIPLQPEVTPEPEIPMQPELPLQPVITEEQTSVSNSGSDQTDILVDSGSPYKVVCYFTNWAWYRQGVGKYLPSDIDPSLCTHIVYGFAVLNGDQMIIKPHDGWADFDNKFYEKVTALRAKGIKVLIAIGGWNDSAGNKYSRLVNNPSARRKFIAHVVDFIEENNFDGLDLDWEYPTCWQVDCNKGPSTDKPAFAQFVKELHEAFHPKGWLLSSAVSPSKRVIDAGYDVPTLSRYLDWIAVMCYDYHGQWDKVTGHVAPMYAHPEDIDDTFNTNFTIHYWIEKGADRRKLVMGMPIYGQSFSLADNSNTGLNSATYGGGEAGEETRARGFLAYYEICRNIINKGWQLVRDRKGRIGPYAYLRDQWVSFDDIDMIRHKSEYIRAMGLGGGMIWALDLDDFRNLCGCEEYPLLRTINRVLRNYSLPDPKCVLGKTNKPTTLGPSVTHQPTKRPSQEPPTEPPHQITPDIVNSVSKSCEGRLFEAHDTNCNQYYLCNQGQLLLQTCAIGLFWNVDHCDWPENTQCHPDGSTTAPLDVTAAVPAVTESMNEIETVSSTITNRPAIDDEGFKVVCYFTNWAWYRQGDGKYLPSDIDPELCTHINYGFAVLDATTLTIKPHDSWADIDNEFYKKVTDYRSRGIKVLIAIGGWNDSLGDKYSRLVNDPQARARFVANVIQFIEKWGFDGLDVDWEYPKCWQVDCNKGPESDKKGFSNLIRELSTAFKPKGLLLSSAVSPSKAVIDAGYDVPVLSQYFDWIAVMTYDFHGHWDKQTGHVAPLYYYPGDTYDYFNANYSIQYWIDNGAPPSKLVMGMPLYGQSFSLADSGKRGLNEQSYGPGEAGEFTRAGGFLAFYEICERVKKRGWVVTRDPEGRIGPYATHGSQWVSYDDISEIRRKSKLVKKWGLGGGMVWALDLDDFRNRCGCGRHPLLKTMNAELRGMKSDITLQNCT